MPALDGLRALAVTAVVLFHYPLGRWFQGGLFGVGVFFVLSGFLVTAGLLDEGDRSGSIDIGRFLAKRAWRLLPALVALLVVFLALAAVFHQQRWFTSSPFGSGGGHPLPLSTAAAGTGAALSYWYNELLAQRWASPSPLGQLWSLSVEGQFYLGAVVVAFVAVRTRFGRWLLPACLAGATVSAAAPFVLWNGGAGQNLIYFGTMSRLQQFLAGAVLAMIWRRGWLDGLPRAGSAALAAAGGATLVALVPTVGNVPFKYLGAFTVTAAATVAVVAHLIRPGCRSAAGRALGHPALVWLGRRSYGIYLWHWPLAEWTNTLPHRWGVPLGLGLSTALAEASWRLVEGPAQRYARRRRASAPGPGTGGAAGR